MENKLKQLFNMLNPREKILLTLVVWAVLIAFINSTFSDSVELKEEWDETGETLHGQKAKLDEAENVKHQLAKLWQKMDPDRTISSTELALKVENIAKSKGLAITAKLPKKTPDGLLDLHTMTISISPTQIEKLIAFDDAIKEKSPYMALQYMSITANSAPPLLRAEFRIRTFERREDI